MSNKTRVVIIFSSIALACLIGAGIVVGVFFNSNNDFPKFSNIFAHGIEIDESEQLDLEDIASLSVDCFSGMIDIVEADTASIELKGQVWTNKKQETYLDVYKKEGTLYIEYNVDNRQLLSFLNIDMRMTVYLPKENMLDLDIKSTSGDINIKDMQFGVVKILSTSGDTSIHDCAGMSLDIDKTSGDTDISNADFESINIACLSGDNTIKQTSASIAIRSTSGDIEIQEATGALLINSTSGKINAKFAGNDIKPIDIGLTSGDVKLYFDENAAFDLEAKGTSSNIKTDFEITVSGSPNEKNALSGKCNGGGALVKIQTTSGNINVLKK